jgi:hypothetical protein
MIGKHFRFKVDTVAFPIQNHDALITLPAGDVVMVAAMPGMDDDQRKLGVVWNGQRFWVFMQDLRLAADEVEL